MTTIKELSEKYDKTPRTESDKAFAALDNHAGKIYQWEEVYGMTAEEASEYLGTPLTD